MDQHSNMLVKGKYGIINKTVLQTNFPIVFNELEKFYSKYYDKPDEIKINSFLESEFNYSICTDPIDGDEDLYIPRLTFHNSDPKKTFSTTYPVALEFEFAKAKATFIALQHIESRLS